MCLLLVTKLLKKKKNPYQYRQTGLAFSQLLCLTVVSGCVLLCNNSVTALPSTGHRECMETLLAHEVDIDQEDPQHGTPLYMACTYQRTECVKKLLELGTPGKGARESYGGVSQHCWSL